MSNVGIDSATRLEWSYGVTRGVYDAPLFTVNDVFVTANHEWTVEKWADLITRLDGESAIEVTEEPVEPEEPDYQ